MNRVGYEKITQVVHPAYLVTPQFEVNTGRDDRINGADRQFITLHCIPPARMGCHGFMASERSVQQWYLDEAMKPASQYNMYDHPQWVLNKLVTAGLIYFSGQEFAEDTPSLHLQTVLDTKIVFVDMNYIPS